MILSQLTGFACFPSETDLTSADVPVRPTFAFTSVLTWILHRAKVDDYLEKKKKTNKRK